MKLSFKKVFGIALLTIGILIVGTTATLWVLFPPEKIKAMVIPEVEKTLSRKVSVGKVGVTLFPVLGVSLSKVEISNSIKDGFSSEPFVKLDRFLVQISVSSISKGYPVISKVVLKKPQILIESNSSGNFNYNDMAMTPADTTNSADTANKEPKKTGLPMLPVPVSLKSFVIEKGSITYVDKKSKQEFIIGDISQKISFDIDKELKDVKSSGNILLSRISIKTKDIQKPLTNLSVTLNHSVNIDLVNGNATVKQLRVSLQKVFLNLTGTISNINSTPEFDLALVSDTINIKELLSEIPSELFPDIAKLSSDGVADLSLKVKGTMKNGESVPVSGTLKLKDVMVKYKSLPKSINNLNADCNFTDSSVAINTLKMNLGDNPVELHGSVTNFKDPFVDLSVLAKINIGDIKEIIELPKGVGFDGNAAINVNAKGKADPADPTKLNVKGTVDLANLSVLYPPLVKPAVINGRFTLSSKAIGQNISVKIGQSSLTLAAAVNNYLSLVFPESTKKLPRPSADFTMSSSMLNVDEIIPPSKETQKTSTSTSTSKPKPKQDIPLIAPLPGVDMKGNVSALNIIYRGVAMSDVNMKVNVLNDIADIEIKTGFASGKINEKIHADLRNTSNVIFNNKLTVDNVEVNDLVGNLGALIKPTTSLSSNVNDLQNTLFGKVSLVSSLSGHGGTQEVITKSLNGDISMKIGEGKIVNSKILHHLSGIVEKFVKINDLRFRDLNAVMHVENELVQFNSFQILSDIGDWDIKGTVGFNTNLRMDILNKLSKENSRMLLSVQNQGKNLAKGLLNAAKLSSLASAYLDNAGIPSDKDDRVTLKLYLGGTTSNPSASFKGFGDGVTKNDAAVESSVKQPSTEQVKQSIELKKKVAQEKVREEQKVIEQEGQRLKNEALKKLKKFF